MVVYVKVLSRNSSGETEEIMESLGQDSRLGTFIIIIIIIIIIIYLFIYLFIYSSFAPQGA
jgi:hypothetical protein